MKYKTIINTISISKAILGSHVKDGDIVLDATVGNGNDSLDLARLVGPNGRVYGFDIQKIAIENTRELLEKNQLLDRVTLVNDSHEYIDKYIEEPLDLVIYNLGYLPRGDKRIKTKASTTVDSLNTSLNLLKENGILILISYIGHPGGLEEKDAVEKRLKELDQKKFNVLKNVFINQENFPPLLYIIEKSL